MPLSLAGREEPLRTQIEFSRRDVDPRSILEAVPGRVAAPYALRPPTVLHYLGEAAIDQKVEALAGRSETQARDVFDLDLLFRRQPELGADPRSRQRASVGELMRATDAYGDLLELGCPVVETGEAAARLSLSNSHASHLLRSLERAGLVRRLMRGLWALDPNPEPFGIAPYLTAPFPAYISFWSALARHGMIELGATV